MTSTDPSVLPPPPHEFRGVIADTYADSVQDWPPPARPPAGAPNIVVIVLDDLGFGQLSCYGGPIDAPHIAALAANGLRFNNFHTTALCSPTPPPADGPEPPLGRLLRDRRDGERVSRVQLVPPPFRRVDRDRPAPARLLHLRRREVAPDPDG
ncbi:MAG: sulfatase-like hydrolase/transferase [Acidimicrobiales bacterium]